MIGIVHTVRYAVRSLAKTPGFSILAVLTLTVGIGGTTALFSVAYAVLWKPLPYGDADQIVQVFATPRGATSPQFSPSLAEFSEWRRLGRVFTAMTATREEMAVLLAPSGPEELTVLRVTSDFTTVFGVAPLIGGGFDPASDERSNGGGKALITYRFWRERFGGSSDVIGKSLRFQREIVEIVGVLPEWFPAPNSACCFVQFNADTATGASESYAIYARIRDHLTPTRAQRELNADVVTTRRAAERTVQLQALSEISVGFARPPLSILFGVVGFILAIACANVASLQLARGLQQQRYFEIRAALGATRAVLICHILTESVLLSLAACVIGTGLASVATDRLLSILPFTVRDIDVGVNMSVLAFSLTLAVLTGVLFGLAPAWVLSAAAPAWARQLQARDAPLVRTLRHGLMMVEIALACLLLVGASLMLRTLYQLTAVNLGFVPEAISTIEVTPLNKGEGIYEQYYTSLVQRLRHLPGVSAAGAIDALPLSGLRAAAIAVTDDTERRRIPVDTREVLPGYFEAMGIPIVSGRDVSLSDREGTQPVVLINEAAKLLYFAGRNPIGQGVILTKVSREIVGVVGNVRHQGQAASIRPEMYVPYLQDYIPRPAYGRERASLIVVIRHAREKRPAFVTISHTAQIPGLPAIVRRMRTGEEWLAESQSVQRRRALLFTLIGSIGLLLTIVGVFSVTAFSVSQRTREIGVRMAVGASRRNVIWKIVSDSFRPVALGLIVGLGAASLATRVVTSFLFETEPTDIVSFCVSALIVSSAALLSMFLAARRAARVDPLVALRCE